MCLDCGPEAHISNYSIVGVSDDPTVELDSASGAGEFHSLTEEDLTSLVVEDDDHEEGEGWASEVREGDLTSTKTTVEREPWEGEVTEEDAKEGLEAESLVSVHVDHTLLGDGQVSGLADKEIGPLHDNNGNQITALRVVERFDGVADLVLRDSGVSPEFRNIRVGTPSALSPLVWLDSGEVETYIDSTFTRSDHVKVRLISTRIIIVTAIFYAIIDCN